MAEADISEVAFRETVYTTVPKMLKTNTMERSKDSPFCFSLLIDIAFIGSLHSDAAGGAKAPRLEKSCFPQGVLGSWVCFTIILYFGFLCQ
jgi:hypothetical protein